MAVSVGITFSFDALIRTFQVIYCQAFICVFLTGKLMSKIFFGELRASEFEVKRFYCSPLVFDVVIFVAFDGTFLVRHNGDLSGVHRFQR